MFKARAVPVAPSAQAVSAALLATKIIFALHGLGLRPGQSGEMNCPNCRGRLEYRQEMFRLYARCGCVGEVQVNTKGAAWRRKIRGDTKIEFW